MEIIKNTESSSMKLLVVIVNFRTPRLAIDCLHSLAEEVRALGAQVVVTDNASGDDSVQRLSAAIQDGGWHDWATLLPLERNGGFAYGNNGPIRAALESESPPDYVLLLNPDTVVRAGAIQSLLTYLEKHPQVGIVGSRLEDPDGTPQRSAFRFHSLLGELDAGLRLGVVSKLLAGSIVAPPVSQQDCATDWVAGASMLVRREVFTDIGLLDEAYFMYFEEVDFCRRAAHARWSCAYEPRSRVVHLVGQASGVTNASAPPKRRPPYWFESRRRYFVTHHGKAYAALVDAVWAISYSTWRVRSKLFRKPHREPPRLLLDFLRHSVLLKGFGA